MIVFFFFFGVCLIVVDFDSLQKRVNSVQKRANSAQRK